HAPCVFANPADEAALKIPGVIQADEVQARNRNAFHIAQPWPSRLGRDQNVPRSQMSQSRAKSGGVENQVWLQSMAVFKDHRISIKALNGWVSFRLSA